MTKAGRKHSLTVVSVCGTGTDGATIATGLEALKINIILNMYVFSEGTHFFFLNTISKLLQTFRKGAFSLVYAHWFSELWLQPMMDLISNFWLTFNHSYLLLISSYIVLFFCKYYKHNLCEKKKDIRHCKKCCWKQNKNIK